MAFYQTFGGCVLALRIVQTLRSSLKWGALFLFLFGRICGVAPAEFFFFL
jgi:hypothetical protein